MTAEIVERVLRSSRYRDVHRSLLARFAAEELVRSRNIDDAVKRVKRRLHQAVGAFRGEMRADLAWTGETAGPGFRAACAEALRSHASTRERIPHLDTFYADIWSHTGVPRSVIDLGCGLGPLALPWMGIGEARYLAIDVDARPISAVRRFFELVGQPHDVEARDLVVDPPTDTADVALMLKLVSTLDRQDAHAATRLLRTLRARHAVVSFATRSLGGRRSGMEGTHRRRLEQLVSDSGRVSAVAEASVSNELVFVLALHA